MRDLRIAPDVAELLGAEMVGRLRAGPAPATVTCRRCRRHTPVDGGGALAVIAAVQPGQVRIVFAHAACEPSATVDDTDTTLQTASGVSCRAILLAGGQPPVLAIAPDVTVYTRPGPEVADQVVAGLLREGLALITTLITETLTALPHLTTWTAVLTDGGRSVRIDTAAGGTLFDLQLGAVPPAWLSAAATHRRLLLLAGTMASPTPAGLTAAAAAGHLTGATVPLA